MYELNKGLQRYALNYSTLSVIYSFLSHKQCGVLNPFAQ